MTHTKRAIAAAAGAVMLATLVACGGDGSDAGGSLSVDRLVTLAEEVGKDGADSCPVPYDAGKAGESAKLGESIEPGHATSDAASPVATAEGGRTTDPQSVWQGKTGALISCSYHVGEEKLEIHTIGTEEGSGIYALAPVIQSAGSMGVDELKSYTEEGAKAKTGAAVPSKSGNVVTVRLDAEGKGDVALVMTSGESGETSLKPEQVVELAKTFAAQAK
ncbi:hypothetical protein ABZ946_35270 [Streptomyces sp. NPDC046324]|uniref:hypothetical protein n=1 Tax=Streptomyces sp. NPDC046324 TaxID=3154915 RepID=UPI0033E1F627